MIRQRFTTSRENLVALLPRLTELSAYDNSIERAIEQGIPPAPGLVLRTACGRIQYVAPRDSIPEWAHPIFAAAIVSARDPQETPDSGEEKSAVKHRRKS